MKKAVSLLFAFAVAVVVGAAGCTPNEDQAGKGGRAKPPAPPPPPEAFLAKLGPVDQKLAEAQKWCAVETDKPLGSMGVPYKTTIKDQPVFLCCKGCLRQAEAHPDKTLATLAELQAKVKSEKKE